MNIESQTRAVARNAAAARLLVVDDEALITATIGATLRQAGFDVTETTSAKYALELCAAEPFDLAIVDERMPGMTGTQLARELRDHHGVPVVFLSAYSDAEFVAAATDVGSFGFFLKPIDPLRMLPALHNILARAKETRVARAQETQLKNALKNEREINTAIGVLMERLRLPREEAFEVLRRYARSHQMQVVKVANDLLQPLNDAHRLITSIASQSSHGRISPSHAKHAAARDHDQH